MDYRKIPDVREGHKKYPHFAKTARFNTPPRQTVPHPAHEMPGLREGLRWHGRVQLLPAIARPVPVPGMRGRACPGRSRVLWMIM